MNETALTLCELTIRLFKAAPLCASVGYALAYLATDHDPYFWLCVGYLLCSFMVYGICGLAKKGA